MSKFIINAFADESDPMITGQIDALCRNDLDGLEIRGVDGQNVGVITLDKAKEVKKLLADKGKNVWSIGSRLGKIQITDSFDAHLEEFKHTLDVANTLETKYIRMFSFYIPKDQNPADFRNEVMDRLGIFLETAKSSGIKLCHENEKGIYGDIASRCLDIANTFPELGCIFDPANYIQCNEDTLNAWKLLGDKVTYMHIKDCLADGSVVPAGEGIGNLEKLLEMYKANGGKAVTVEPHLTIFKGLEAFERSGEESKIGKYEYRSKTEAFDTAIAALRKII